jgi:tryptophan synthase beta chain
MVKVSYLQKPYRRALMETYGARCIASPSAETEYGRSVLARSPDSNGSLGIAISEAVEVAASRSDTKYALGSVLNHVLLHQTVVGLEAMEQMQLADDYPDVIVGCTGGGSNFAGIAFPFLGSQLRGGRKVRIVAVEPAACPSLTRGHYAYDFGDTGHMTPLTKMHTLGSSFMPPGFHAGGLRYHGMRHWCRTSSSWGSSKHVPTTSCSASKRASSSRSTRESSRRPRRIMRSGARSRRRNGVAKRA